MMTKKIDLKLSVYDPKVNLAALLNDPRKSRRDHDMFTKTWGGGFRDFDQGAIVSKSIKIPCVSGLDFMEYLSQTQEKLERHRSWFVACNDSEKFFYGNKTEDNSDTRSLGLSNETLSHSNSYILQIQERKHTSTREALHGIPRMFLRPEFSLEDSNTFLAVLKFDFTHTRQENQTNSFNVMQKISSSKLLQEKFSFYLDLVEVALVRQISVQSDAFFDAMTSHDELNDCLRRMLANVHQLRRKLSTIANNISRKSLQVVHFHSELKHKIELLHKLQTVITVHQAQPTIQLLLSTSEYAGALDMIETTQEVLKLELAGVHCFRHLSSQLSEIELVIGQMMKEELSNCIRNDIHRPLSEGYSTVNPHHLAAITHGLLRREHLDFFAEFKEEIKVAVKSIIKETVMEAVVIAEERTADAENKLEKEQDDSEGDDTCNKRNISEKAETLAGRMRLLEFDEWISLLNCIFNNLSIFLRRIKAFLLEIIGVIDKSAPFMELCISDIDQNHFFESQFIEAHATVPCEMKHTMSTDSEVLQSVSVGADNVWEEMDQYEMQLMKSVNLNTQERPKRKQTKNSSEPTNKVTDEEHRSVIRSICESLAWTSDFAHDRCVKIIIARNKNSSLEKLSTLQFLSLSQSIAKYLADTEAIIMRAQEKNTDGTPLHYNDFFTACFRRYSKRSSVLRGVLHSQALHFISRFHEERKCKLSLILDNETWKQSEVPVELAKLIQKMIGRTFPEDANTLDKLDEVSSKEACMKLCINGASFSVVGTVLLLLKMVSEYMSYADDLPASTPDLTAKVCELLSFFNSRTSQLLLGATALQLAGLKTITSRNLGLASRCVQLVLTMLPYIKIHFKEKLEQYFPLMTQSKQLHCLRHFDHVEKDYKDHITEIESKLVNIMNSAIDSHLSRWEVKAPMPSHTIRTICRQISKLHETILDLLSKEQVQKIMSNTHLLFKKHFHRKLQQYGVRNDGGPQCGLVMSDLAFYQGHIENLEVFKDTDLEMYSVWL